MGLCFCEHCRRGAAASGIDAEAARRRVEADLVAAFDRDRPARSWPDFPAEGINAFAAAGELHAWLSWRESVVTSLVEEIRAEAHPGTRIVVISDSATWTAGLDLDRVARACDGLLLCLYGAPVAEVAGISDMRRAIGAEKFLGVGFRLFHPETSDAEHLAELSQTAISAGANGINYYNYGLVPEKRLAWIAEATRSLA